MKFFRDAAEFRRWLEGHHDQAAEMWVGFYKKGTGKPGIAYKEAVDEALCFGWIDAVRKSLGETSYTIRFTPRQPTSIWSQINVRRVQELIDLGRMRPPGRAAFERRDARRMKVYAFEQDTPPKLGPAEEKVLRANRKAFAFFDAQPPSYQRVASWWVVSAKKEETRKRRLASLIEHSANGQRLPQYRPTRAGAANAAKRRAAR